MMTDAASGRLVLRETSRAVDCYATSEAWQGFLDTAFPNIQVDDIASGAFRANVLRMDVHDVSLSLIATQKHSVERTLGCVSRGHADYAKLMWSLNGELQIEQDRRRATLRPGLLSICDTARPYRIEVPDNAEFLVMSLPYAKLSGWLKMSEGMTGRPLSGLAFDASLASLITLIQKADVGQINDCETVLASVNEMIAAALARCAMALSGTKSRDQQKFVAAMQLIRQHVLDHELSPDFLANKLHMSKRSLYLLFQENQSSPATAISDARFERVLQLLRDPSLDQQTISRAAIDCGFGNLQAFSKAFRKRYGASPREWKSRSKSAVH